MALPAILSLLAPARSPLREATQRGARARLNACQPRHLALLALLLPFALLFPAQAQPITQGVRLPNQEYTESREDLKVKVLGGHVRINRSWVAGRWYLNPAWANLRFIADPLGGVLAVDRAGSLYERVGGSGSGSGTGSVQYAFGAENFIARQPSGWRWYDRQGNSIDYDEAGRIQSYSNPAGVTVRFEYNAQGHLSRVLDHHGQAALSLQSDSQGRVVQVADASDTGSGRTVRYTWSGTGASSQLAQVTDVQGHIWKYEYNAQGQITKRTDPLGASIELQYMTNPAMIPDSPGFAGMGAGGGASGTLMANSGPLAASSGIGAASSVIGATKVSAPQIARVASYRDESGGRTNYRIEWDRVRRQYTVHTQEPSGLQRTQIYNKDGLLLADSVAGLQRSVDSATRERLTDARGLVTTIEHNAARQPIRTTHPDGSQESNTYDSQGRRTSHTNALGQTSRWRYDAQGNVIQHIEAEGTPEQRTTVSTYDPYGQLKSRTRGAGDGQGPDAITERFEYDKRGNLIQRTDGLGRTSRASYNSQGQPLSQTNALKQTTRLSYDAAGNLTHITNPLGQTLSHSYDARGRRTQTTTAEGKVQRTRYNAGGQVIETLAPGQSQGKGSRIEYDQAGRPVKTISPSGLITTTAYDSLGRISKTTDPAGNVTTYEYGPEGSPLAGLLTAVNYPTYKETYQYDQRNRQTAVTQHLSSTETRIQRQAYDAQGQRISTTDAAGHSTLYQYDALGRLTQTTDALGGTTKQSWDAHEQLTSLTDAKGNTHKFDYDKAGQLIRETRPLGGAIQYAYDQAGNLTQRTDAGGNTRSYSYDAASRMTQEEHKLDGTSADQKISYQYDKDGQLKGYEQTDGQGQLISQASYQRDAQGRVATSDHTYGKADGTTFSFQIGQSFNADGQLASHQYPDGSTQSYSYSAGRLSKVTLPNGSEISYGHYQWMVPGQISTPGAIKTQTFDALQRPISIEVKSQTSNSQGNHTAQRLMSRLYQYDQAGNITQIKSELGQTDYGYDNLSRLTSAQPDQNLQALGLPAEQYSYDAVHNRMSSAHQPGAWSYNADNQLTQYPYLKPFSPGSQPVDTTVSYTAQGHTQKESNSQWTKDYGYNAAERLIRYTQTSQGQSNPQLEAQYKYDPFGRRITKTITQGNSTTTTYFVYSEQGLMGEANEQGQLTRAYGFNPIAAQQGLWSADPIWQAEVTNASLTATDTSYHYLHTDHLGTPQLATTKDGNTSWKAAAEAFGAAGIIQSQSTIEMNLRFPGQYYDEETGTHYNFHRDYRPNAGRYIQGDPLNVPDGGVNIYSYSAANPTMLSDPWGLVEWKGAYTYFAFDVNISKKLVAKFFRLKFGPGGGLMVGDAALSTKCVGGKTGQVKINFTAAFFAAGVGVLDKVQSSAEGAGITCEAPMSVESFNGFFGFGSVGAGPFAATLIRFGSAICPSPGPTRTLGDFTQISTGIMTFTGAVGVSVASGKIEDCCDD